MASEIAHLFLESSYHVMFVLRDSEPYGLSVWQINDHLFFLKAGHQFLLFNFMDYTLVSMH